MIPEEFRPRLRRFARFAGAVALVFALPLCAWVRFSIAHDLFSYALLIPFVSAWLIWQLKGELKFEYHAAPRVAAVLALSAGILAAGALAGHPASRLPLQILAFACAFNAVAVHTLGGAFMRQIRFPAAFLLFMTPIPPAGVELIEVGLQHASATVSGWFFSWTGASYLQHGLVFQLPNITLEVAPECSGIRSTLVLFITSLIAGYLFLRRPWQRAAFTALVIPLGIARNAVRIVTIGWLCIEHGPEMIHSAIHRRGGPVFFALSLVPLFLMLLGFRWCDRRATRIKLAVIAPEAGRPATEPGQ